ncbi:MULTISPECIES: GNAT family N-acetyltransferase [unclassified Neorhizobium]|uniref:GNAT family N-acetyltransferase n=2 Tax=unclassified Neorhizobium TaxID=2629175 RepID=UPI001FF5E576|nr:MULTISPECIES: GNAT family N-acetyltransferase [unclassified Neorhizobium]MCJ9668841.1 GNAT family N-acetyltransferase [Neorhizobium sp. SHOUNA12B]MCJ9744647.1 GNAT family N-acetyltransferase [Neorhizobium sp. SHOUNA12A]
MMDSELPETLTVDNFEMCLADVSNVEISKLQSLSISVGWPHRAADWQHLLDIGKGYVALDEIGRVGASGMWFPHGDGFATFGMLITSPRLQANGTARWLMKRIMADCGRNRIRLNSTREARRLYASLGFEPKQTVYQCQGTAIASMSLAPLEEGLVLRRLDRGDLEAVIAFDTPAFGTERRLHLQRLFESSICYGLYQGARLRAFSMRRRFGRGHVVGPVVAGNDEDAITVTYPHIAAHADGFLRLDTHIDTGPFAALVQQCGLGIYATLTTMVTEGTAGYGTGQNDSPKVYALASHSLG